MEVKRGPPRLRARGRIALSGRKDDGLTTPHTVAESGSLRVRFPSPEDHGLSAVLVNTAGGIAGGDRFDIVENRALGRAYLARMYRRYGNWADAVAAYNWGPRNIDAWITTGRATDLLPLEVERYRDRVLRDAAVMLNQ